MRPRTPFVAGFVGDIQRFLRTDGRETLWHDGKLRPATGTYPASTPLVNSQANGAIQAVQYQGAATRFELKLNGGENLLVSQANMTGEELPAAHARTTGDGFLVA